MMEDGSQDATCHMPHWTCQMSHEIVRQGALHWRLPWLMLRLPHHTCGVASRPYSNTSSTCTLIFTPKAIITEVTSLMTFPCPWIWMTTTTTMNIQIMVPQNYPSMRTTSTIIYVHSNGSIRTTWTPPRRISSHVLCIKQSMIRLSGLCRPK